jgi:hypothetical protein
MRKDNTLQHRIDNFLDRKMSKYPEIQDIAKNFAD